MQIDHGEPDSNETVSLVVEDTINADSGGVRRKVYGLNSSGRMLREAVITDPNGSPQYWCRSWKYVADTGAKLNRVEQERTPAAHNVTASTLDEFLDPSNIGTFTNDTSTLNSSAGLIRVYEYNDDGNRSAERLKQGSSGTSYYVSATDYYGGSNIYRKHLPTARDSYPQSTPTRSAPPRAPPP